MHVVVEQTTSSTAAVEEKRTRDSTTPTAAGLRRRTDTVSRLDASFTSHVSDVRARSTRRTLAASADKRQQARVNIAYFQVYPDTKEACLNLQPEPSSEQACLKHLFSSFQYAGNHLRDWLFFSIWDIVLIFLI
jgi:hypothetical protein